MKINEIFYSLQGEGHHSGTPAIFIRFSGCNLKCPFCDTAHTEGTTMTEAEILETIAKYPAKMVVLTGGEPSLFVTATLIDALKSRGYYIAIETNGTNPLPKGINWVTLSPKDAFVNKTKEAIPILTQCDELKVVFTEEQPQAYRHIDAQYRYLQPCDTGNAEHNSEIINRCIEYIKAHPEWRLSLQTHKLLGIR